MYLGETTPMEGEAPLSLALSKGIKRVLRFSKDLGITSSLIMMLNLIISVLCALASLGECIPLRTAVFRKPTESQ